MTVMCTSHPSPFTTCTMESPRLEAVQPWSGIEECSSQLSNGREFCRWIDHDLSLARQRVDKKKYIIQTHAQLDDVRS
jgi:hypothetical protein